MPWVKIMFTKETKIDCQYASIQKDGISCSIGVYGGKPKEEHCLRCISRGDNNPEFAAKLASLQKTTHPESAPKVSGCCDSAENPPA